MEMNKWAFVDDIGIPREAWEKANRESQYQIVPYMLEMENEAICHGGYCKRHERTVRANYRINGNLLCRKCAALMKTRESLGMPHDIGDL